MGRREEEIRMLSLQIGDMRRRVEVQKKKENTVPEVAEQILRTSNLSHTLAGVTSLLPVL